ncbi:unnamed protein product [Chrysoparadoxa australica]
MALLPSLPLVLPTCSSICTFWGGTSVAIGLEARTKFKAKTLTRKVGLDVGRTVFKAQHKLELSLAAAAIAAKLMGAAGNPMALLVAAGTLALQQLYIAPQLYHRADAEIKGNQLPPSKDHIYYIITTGLKVMACLAV